jgi:hypothetical protein
MTTYALVSIPPSVEPPLDSLVASDTAAQLRPFAIPEFKIGTLDALVQQADDLAKLNSACEGLVQKVLDTLRTLHDGDQDKVQRDQIVNDSQLYSSSFYSYLCVLTFMQSICRTYRPIPSKLRLEQSSLPSR